MKTRRVDYSPDEMIAGITGQMTAAQFGVYWLICTLIYSRGGAIADDPKWLSRIFRDTDPRTIRAAINHLVDTGKVVRVDGELVVNRCRVELERAANRTRKAAENGAKGGRPSKENKNIAEADGLQPEKLTINHQPSTINHQRQMTWDDSDALMVVGNAVVEAFGCRDWSGSFAQVVYWRKAGHSPADIIEAARRVAERQAGAQIRNPFSYLDRCLAEEVARMRSEAATPVDARRDQWAARLRTFGDSGFWVASWGPKPGERGCDAPADLIATILTARAA